MTEAAPRTLEEIQKEYTQLVLKTGTLQYEVFIKEKEIKSTNETLQALNVEYAKSQQHYKEAPKLASVPEGESK